MLIPRQRDLMSGAGDDTLGDMDATGWQADIALGDLALIS
jgi:hypothetical protein